MHSLDKRSGLETNVYLRAYGYIDEPHNRNIMGKKMCKQEHVLLQHKIDNCYN